MSDIKEWLVTHKKKVVVALIGVICAIVIGIIAVTSIHGRMSLSQQAADLAQRQVDDDSVQYYSRVCKTLNKTNDVPLDFASLSSDTLGKPPEDVAHIYHGGLMDAREKVDEYYDALVEIDRHAPTVTRADDMEFDYSHALQPVIDDHKKLSNDIGREASRDEYGSNDSQLIGNAVSDANEVLVKGTHSIMDDMHNVTDNAPITTEATADAVKGLPECFRLFGADFEDREDSVVKSLVDFRDLTDQAHDDVSGALSGLGIVSDVQMGGSEVVVDTLRQVAARVHDEAGYHADQLMRWHNNEEYGTPEWRATDAVNDIHKRAGDTYRGIADWSSDVMSRLDDPNVVMSDENVNHLLETISNEWRDKQIEEAKLHADIQVGVQMPTQATVDALSSNDSQDKNDDEVNNDIVRYFALTRGLGDRVSFMTSSRLSGEGATPDDVHVLADDVRGLADTTKGELQPIMDQPAFTSYRKNVDALMERVYIFADALDQLADNPELAQDESYMKDAIRTMYDEGVKPVMVNMPDMNDATRDKVTEIRSQLNNVLSNHEDPGTVLEQYVK